MKKVMMAAAVVALFAVSAFAADPAPQATPEQKAPQAVSPDQKFEQRKARILKHIELRITKAQEAKACIEAAKGRDDLKACSAKIDRKGRKHHPRRDRGAKVQQDQVQQPAQPAAQPQK